MMLHRLLRVTFCLVAAGVIPLIPLEYGQAKEIRAAQDGHWVQAIHVGEDGKDRVAFLELTDGDFSFVRFVRDPQMLVGATTNESVPDSLDRDDFRDGWAVEEAVDGDLKSDPEIAVVYDKQCDLLRVTENGRSFEMRRAAISSFEVVMEADVDIPPVTPIGDKQRGRWTSGLVTQPDSHPMARYDIYELAIAGDDTFEMTAYSLLQSKEFTPLGLLRVFHYDGKVLSTKGQLLRDTGPLQQEGEMGHNAIQNSVRYDAACDELVVTTRTGQGTIGIVRFYRPKRE